MWKTRWNLAAGLMVLAAGTPCLAQPVGAEAVTGASKPSGDPALDTKKVYVMELKGWFGKDISQTPIREAIADAKRLQPDYLIVVMDNDWALHEGFTVLTDDVVGAFDQLFRAEDMDPIFTHEIPSQWENPPKIVFWIKKAMGGAAFLPLSSPTIYFAPEGRLGGVSGIEEMLKGGGDEVVVQKQLSLRLRHAEGMAIQGGHEAKLIQAMCLNSYILSVRYDGDEPEYLERTPENDAEYMLTDDGLNANADSDAAKARGEGNDILTINAETARKLKLSQGTAATLDDLLFELGISRNSEVLKGRADSIMARWRGGIASYGRDLRSHYREFTKIMVDGDTPRERNRKRGQQIAKLEDMKKIMKKYKEAIDPREVEMPPASEIDILIGKIRTEMQLDK